MTTPHESWASIYDVAYEQSFGEFYNDLTSVTIDTIKDIIKPPARIVDYGAGTGRLSVPLASMGYEVMAVEPSREMIKQLTRKAGALPIGTFHGKMEEFRTDNPYDMAVCVFTVLLYLLDEDSLQRSIKAAANALRHGGFMLIDIPSKALFRSYQKETETMHRSVSVSRDMNSDIYQYSERITMKKNGKYATYTDHFCIKYWEAKDVLNTLSECGFSIDEDMSDEFSGAGSNYFLMKKEE